MTEFNNPNTDDSSKSSSPSYEKPAVSAPAARTLLIIGGIILVGGYTLYKIASKKEETVVEVQKPKSNISERTEIISPPPPPPPPPLPPVAALPPPPPPLPSDTTELTTEFDQINSEEKQRRMKSEMLITNKSTFDQMTKSDKNSSGRRRASDDPNSQFASDVSDSEAEKSVAKKIGNPNSVIFQGKVIDAVLETALSTELPGSIRAIVSNDIYAESGKRIMLPRGSRLIGVYNTFLKRGQQRTFIIWERVIRPDGIDVKLASYGIDNIGRSGLAGMVDSRFTEIFSTAVLTSTLTLAGAFAIQEAVGDKNATVSRRTFSDGSSETSGTPTAQAASRMVGNLSSAGENLVDQFFDLRPIIMVNQGTPIKVFVNRDLEFPASLMQNVNIVR